jgi:hypothetical protein
MAKHDLRTDCANDNYNVIPMAKYRRPSWEVDPPSSHFEILCARAHEASAFYKWQHAVYFRKRSEGKPFQLNDESAFFAFVEATIEVAKFPVATAREIRMKKSVIGSIWLKTEGAHYDNYRACVARDEAALAAVKAARQKNNAVDLDLMRCNRLSRPYCNA